MWKPPFCPNPDCKCHDGKTKDFFQRNGSYRIKSLNTEAHRYICTHCGKSFTSRFFKGTLGQKRADLNKPILDQLASGASQRAIARNLGTTPNTVKKKLSFLLSEQS